MALLRRYPAGNGALSGALGAGWRVLRYGSLVEQLVPRRQGSMLPALADDLYLDTGVSVVSGVGSGVILLTGGATGTVGNAATATGVIGLSGTATGVVVSGISGAASGVIGLTNVAAGTVSNTGVASGVIGLVGDAQGTSGSVPGPTGDAGGGSSSASSSKRRVIRQSDIERVVPLALRKRYAKDTPAAETARRIAKAVTQVSTDAARDAVTARGLDALRDSHAQYYAYIGYLLDSWQVPDLSTLDVALLRNILQASNRAQMAQAAAALAQALDDEEVLMILMEMM